MLDVSNFGIMMVNNGLGLGLALALALADVVLSMVSGASFKYYC